jgi:hypothetical protein
LGFLRAPIPNTMIRSTNFLINKLINLKTKLSCHDLTEQGPMVKVREQEERWENAIPEKRVI